MFIAVSELWNFLSSFGTRFAYGNSVVRPGFAESVRGLRHAAVARVGVEEPGSPARAAIARVGVVEPGSPGPPANAALRDCLTNVF